MQENIQALSFPEFLPEKTRNALIVASAFAVFINSVMITLLSFSANKILNKYYHKK
jgi:hypothetical protein